MCIVILESSTSLYFDAYIMGIRTRVEFCCFCYLANNCANLTVVVAQLAERSLPIPEV